MTPNEIAKLEQRERALRAKLIELATIAAELEQLAELPGEDRLTVVSLVAGQLCANGFAVVSQESAEHATRAACAIVTAAQKAIREAHKRKSPSSN